MTEDDKPFYDMEVLWGQINSGRDKVLTFIHKESPSLFRIVDISNETIIFSDINRVKRIRDINKVLSREDNEEENKKNYLPIVMRVANEVYPITMPYEPQTLTCFIEVFPGFSSTPDTLGILYFRDETNGIKEAEMIEAKRYFRINPIGAIGSQYEELSEKIYNNVKQIWIRKEEDKANE